MRDAISRATAQDKQALLEILKAIAAYETAPPAAPASTSAAAAPTANHHLDNLKSSLKGINFLNVFSNDIDQLNAAVPAAPAPTAITIDEIKTLAQASLNRIITETNNLPALQALANEDDDDNRKALLHSDQHKQHYSVGLVQTDVAFIDAASLRTTAAKRAVEVVIGNINDPANPALLAMVNAVGPDNIRSSIAGTAAQGGSIGGLTGAALGNAGDETIITNVDAVALKAKAAHQTVKLSIDGLDLTDAAYGTVRITALRALVNATDEDSIRDAITVQRAHLGGLNLTALVAAAPSTSPITSQEIITNADAAKLRTQAATKILMHAIDNPDSAHLNGASYRTALEKIKNASDLNALPPVSSATPADPNKFTNDEAAALGTIITAEVLEHANENAAAIKAEITNLFTDAKNNAKRAIDTKNNQPNKQLLADLRAAKNDPDQIRTQLGYFFDANGFSEKKLALLFDDDLNELVKYAKTPLSDLKSQLAWIERAKVLQRNEPQNYVGNITVIAKSVQGEITLAEFKQEVTEFLKEDGVPDKEIKEAVEDATKEKNTHTVILPKDRGIFTRTKVSDDAAEYSITKNKSLTQKQQVTFLAKAMRKDHDLQWKGHEDYNEKRGKIILSELKPGGSIIEAMFRKALEKEGFHKVEFVTPEISVMAAPTA